MQLCGNIISRLSHQCKDITKNHHKDINITYKDINIKKSYIYTFFISYNFTFKYGLNNFVNKKILKTS